MSCRVSTQPAIPVMLKIVATTRSTPAAMHPMQHWRDQRRQQKGEQPRKCQWNKFRTWLWGPIGLLLSTPLTVCLVVIGQPFPTSWLFLSILLQR